MSGVELLALPLELQVAVYSFLSSNDLNVWRLVSKERKGFIDGHEKKFYSSRLVKLELEAHFTMLGRDVCLSVHRRLLTMKLTFIDGICDHVMVIFNLKQRKMGIVYGQTRDQWNTHAVERLRSSSFESCVMKLLEKSGGSEVTITSAFNPYFTHFYHKILEQARCLRLFSTTTAVPKDENDVLWDMFFLHKRRLFLNHRALFDSGSGKCIIDDRFVREAAKDELVIDAHPLELRMTEDQLFRLVNRSDIHTLYLTGIIGITAEGCRTIIQILLDTTMNCTIRGVDFKFDENAKATLTETRGQEEIRKQGMGRGSSFLPQIYYVTATRRVSFLMNSPSDYVLSASNLRKKYQHYLSVPERFT